MRCTGRRRRIFCVVQGLVHESRAHLLQSEPHVGIHGGFHLAYLGAALAGGATVLVGTGPALWLAGGAAYAAVAAITLVSRRRRSAVQPVPQEAQVAG